MSFLHMFSSAVLMILLISLLIIIHEFGHFLAAKAVGIRVDKFGFGLPVGPTLFSKKFGETEILIHAFLLGGYVSFPDDEEDCDLPKDSPKRFSNKTVGQRMLVICAGVIFNLLLAFYMIFSAGLIWHKLPLNKFNVYFKEFAPTAIQQVKDCGLQPDDIIYSINGTEIKYPITINKIFTLSKEFDGFASKTVIENKYEKLQKLNPSISPNEPISPGTTVLLPDFTDEQPVQLSTAQAIGIEKYKPGEIELTDVQKSLRDKINYAHEYTTESNVSLSDIAAAISDTKKPISIIVLRNDKQIPIKTVYTDKEGILGIKQSYSEAFIKTDNILEVTKGTYIYVKSNIGFMLYTLGKLFTGKVPMSEMNGIIAVTKIGTELIAYKGIFDGILLTALISLNLAIINILPIPALDGGHMLFLIIEKITGKPVNKKFVEGLSNFFFYLLIALMVLIVYNDIHAWIIGKI